MIIISVGGIFIVGLIFLVSITGTLILLYLTLWLADFSALLAAHEVKLTVFIVAVLIMDLLSLFYAYIIYKIFAETSRNLKNKKALEAFVLKEEYQYGDVLLPAGTKITRYDPYDSTGDKERASRLTGLISAEFPSPIKVASVWASAIETDGLLRLSRNQRISGVFCRTNQMVRFHVPSVGYNDTRDPEIKQGEPDVRLMTAQWVFWECEAIRK
ncbi:MAG TPA: hypothetical protein ENJ08_10330 [Gammaproteobacteria bacterium]|nr:hypothetical protein [Gammaproteobacteria bacterium]